MSEIAIETNEFLYAIDSQARPTMHWNISCQKKSSFSSIFLLWLEFSSWKIRFRSLAVVVGQGNQIIKKIARNVLILNFSFTTQYFSPAQAHLNQIKHLVSDNFVNITYTNPAILCYSNNRC